MHGIMRDLRELQRILTDCEQPFSNRLRPAVLQPKYVHLLIDKGKGLTIPHFPLGLLCHISMNGLTGMGRALHCCGAAIRIRMHNHVPSSVACLPAITAKC